jgi:Galactose oxidase-like, Early set domain
MLRVLRVCTDSCCASERPVLRTDVVFVRLILVSLMDFGFSTHGVQMDQRLVHLDATLSLNRRSLSIRAPPNPRIYPPGPAYLFVVTNTGVPSFGHKLIVGTGASPPVDEGAIAK